MIILAGLTIIGLLFIALVWIAAYYSKKPDTVNANVAKRAARHLQRALDDPMFRQGPEWESVAQEIIDDYYGK